MPSPTPGQTQTGSESFGQAPAHAAEVNWHLRQQRPEQGEGRERGVSASLSLSLSSEFLRGASVELEPTIHVMCIWR